jgi:hypothetical protein
MEQQQQVLTPPEIDSMEQYRRESIALRIKLGITSNRLTPEQEKIYREEQRKIWLKINDPKKLEREYGRTDSQS